MKLTRSFLIAAIICVVSSTASAGNSAVDAQECSDNGGTPRYQEVYETGCWWIGELLGVCENGSVGLVYAGCSM
jgi:hypothetical protein